MTGFGTLLKRDFILYKRGFLSALIFAALIFALCAGAFAAFIAAEGGYGALPVMLVDEDGSGLSKLAIKTVSGQSYMKASLDIKTTTREKAMKALREGECAAVIILPEGYFEDIMHGRDCKGEIILSSAAALNADLVENIARAGEVLLAAGQYGVFCGERVIRDYDLSEEFYDAYINTVNAALIESATGAYKDCFTLTAVDYEDTGMSLSAHYALCWFIAAAILCGMFFSALINTDLNMLPRLKVCGVGDTAFMTGKILYPAITRFAVFTIAAYALKDTLGLTVSAGTLACAMICAVYLTVTETALIMGLYESGGTVSTALMFAGIFLMGGIIPRGMLPQWMKSVSFITPFGAAWDFLSPVGGGKINIPGLAAAAVYTLISLWTIKRRLESEKRGGRGE